MIQRKTLMTSITLLLLFCLTAPVALALATRNGDLVEVKAGEVINDDLYVAGNQIVIDGTIKGDLFVVGSDAVINGVVEGDLFFAGQSLTLNGEVKDDLRMGLTAFTLGPNGQVGDDLLAGGYSLETKAGSQIGGQMYFGASQALLAGAVKGDVNAGVNGLQVDGTIGGNLNAATANRGDRPFLNPMQFNPNAPKVPVVAPGLLLGKNASIGGNLNLQSRTDPGVDIARVKGDFNFSAQAVNAPPTPQEQALAAGKGAASRFLGAFLIGLLLLWLMPGFMRRAATVLHGNKGGGFGWGLLAYIGLPILMAIAVVIVIILASIVGNFGLSWLIGGFVGAAVLAVLLMLALFVFIIVLVGKIAVGTWLGRLLTGQRDAQRGRLWLPMLLGLVVVSVLIAIPYAGAIFNLIFSVWGLGAVWLALRGRTATIARKPHPYALQ